MIEAPHEKTCLPCILRVDLPGSESYVPHTFPFYTNCIFIILLIHPGRLIALTTDSVNLHASQHCISP
ncbi:hypothetical protein DAEQUDRAFT_731918 [Daedalea quercina L-15889]|uniref:Uncharacterized protein n=1 Tax=Daedalea quercina L-15889 TaxID=1314783 RepID=A0A165LZP1_9APHY|nr:hypothetical protein DAEQUDRAFT_731918 [Daedalea quercina L-15889]